MDDAGNCNTTATNLVPLNPHFKGTPWRGYCFLHIIQLSAKVSSLYSFFSPLLIGPRKIDGTLILHQASDSQEAHVEEVVLDGTPPDQEDADLALGCYGAARNEHDTAVVSKIHIAAIQAMAAQGVTIDSSESKRGLQLIPRVCGLARKLHDSVPIASSFAKLVDADKTIVGQTQTLARWCASRWNSDYDSLDTALILEQPVRKLLKEKDLNLKAFKLTDAQWNLAADLHDVLECIKEPTLTFSRGRATRPLISEVIPALETLRCSLTNAANSTEISNICRVAAYGGGLVLDKYIDLVPNCEAYEFSIVLSPNLKLDWFKKHSRSMTQIRRIRETIVARYNKIF
ncbi:hypothetical protein DFH07DRAFT_993225, partial [Mycena maculata]